MEKLYVIVRNDLTPGLQIAQACHALREFVADHPALDRAWHEGQRNIVVLQVPGLRELERLAAVAVDQRIPLSRFTEPDLQDQLTAVALARDGEALVSSLPLALRAA